MSCLLVLPAARANDVDAEQRFTDLVAQERARVGAAALAGAADLVDVARRHAARMADEDRLHHNPRLADEVEGWQALGENVGRGGTADAIHTAFMQSATHRANILDRRFTQIGVGVVARDGELWVVQVFRLPAAQPVAPPRPPSRPHPPAAPVAPVGASTPRPAATPAPTTPPPTTTTVIERRPPVAGLPPGPVPAATGGVEVLAGPALAVPPLEDIPPATKLAASLLVLVVAAQVLTLRRLHLV